MRSKYLYYIAAVLWEAVCLLNIVRANYAYTVGGRVYFGAFAFLAAFFAVSAWNKGRGIKR